MQVISCSCYSLKQWCNSLTLWGEDSQIFFDHCICWIFQWIPLWTPSISLCNLLRMFWNPFWWEKKKKKPCIKSLSIADYRKFCSSSTSQFQFLPVSTKLTCSLYVVGMLFLWTSFDLNYASKWNKNNQKVAINYFSLILFNEFHFHGVWSSWPDPSIALSITWIMYKPIEICLWEESWFPCL